MKKLILALFIFSAIAANAQNNSINTTAFSAGFELGIPANGIYTIGLGISAKGEIPIAPKVSLTGTVGFSTFFYKSNLFNSSRTPSPAAYVPLKIGGKYYFNEGLYIEGEAGAVVETNYLKQDLFAFSIGPGFVVPTANGHGIDFSFRYESWSNHQVRQSAIRFAYRFGR